MIGWDTKLRESATRVAVAFAVDENVQRLTKDLLQHFSRVETEKQMSEENHDPLTVTITLQLHNPER